jgi:hypothetical protein
MYFAYIVAVVKAATVRWAGLVERIAGNRNVCTVFVKIPGGTRPGADSR